MKPASSIDKTKKAASHYLIALALKMSAMNLSATAQSSIITHVLDAYSLIVTKDPVPTITEQRKYLSDLHDIFQQLSATNHR